MSTTSDFYLAQAEKCSAEASSTALVQVRDRNLRAAAAWHSMAEKILQTEVARARTAAAKDIAASIPE